MANLDPQNLIRFELRISSTDSTTIDDSRVIYDMLNQLHENFGNVEIIRVNSSGVKNTTGNIVITGFAKYDLPFEGFLSKHLPIWQEHFDSRLTLYTTDVTKFA